MNIKTIILIFCFTISKIVLVNAMPAGSFNEFRIDQKVKEQIHYIDNSGYEYIAYDSILIFNIKSSKVTSVSVNDERISLKPLNYNIESNNTEWRFSDKYLNDSGTLYLHNNTVYLPDCRIGNVCDRNNFSIFFNVNVNPQKIKLYLNNIDVTTLFYYNQKLKTFKLKEYHDVHFFSKFKTDVATLTWKFNEVGKNYDGKIKIFLGTNNIKGTIRDKTGKFPIELAGRKVYFTYCGSDTLAPHKMETLINEDGSYELKGLPTLDYKITIDIFPEILPDLQSISLDNTTKILNITHVVPYFDVLLSAEKDKIGAGDFIVFNLPAFNAGLAGHINRLDQLSGDYMHYKTDNNTITVLTPVSNHLKQDITLLGTMQSGKRFILYLPNPVSYGNEYIQFGMFSKNGRYAKTVINGIDDGVFNENNDISFAVNTMDNIKKDNVKIHYYYSNNKAVDITSFFDWDDIKSEAILNKNIIADFENSLDYNGVIAGTFCSDINSERCYRIKHDIRPGIGNISVNIDDLSLDNNSKIFLVLKEIEVKSNPIVKVIQLKQDTKKQYMHIPVGSYQIKIVDLSLTQYGSVFADINPENKNINVTVKTKIADKNTDIRKITDGNLIRLVDEPVVLNRNDFEIIDLTAFYMPVKGKINKSGVLGILPVEYELYKDNNIMFVTSNEYKSSYATVFFDTDDKKYILPVYYSGDDYVMVKEAGMDYSMCPLERPYCVNAFVQLGGVKQGIYNGKGPFFIILPFDFKQNDIKLYMESDVDVTDMFFINPAKRSITLRRSVTPAFLSTLSAATEPITLLAGKHKYYISLIPGYKSITASIIDESGAQTSDASGLKARLSCKYDVNKYYTQIETINDSIVTFNDLPDCNYDLELLDKRRVYTGKVGDIKLTVGQNNLRTLFQVHCKGSDGLFIADCKPFLPIVDDVLISPGFGVHFLNTENPIDRIEIEPFDNVSIKHIADGLLIYDKSKEQQDRIIKVFSGENYYQRTYVVMPASRMVISEVPNEYVSIKKIRNIPESLIYNGQHFNIMFNTDRKYKVSEIAVALIADDKINNIKQMFYWDEKLQILYLKRAETANFMRILSKYGSQLLISIGEHYQTSLIISVGAADIVGVLSADYIGDKKIIKPTILLSGVGKNYFRKAVSLSKNNSFKFFNVPYGMYDIIVFDQNAQIYGRREIEVHDDGMELNIEVPVSYLADEKKDAK